MNIDILKSNGLKDSAEKPGMVTGVVRFPPRAQLTLLLI